MTIYSIQPPVNIVARLLYSEIYAMASPTLPKSGLPRTVFTTSEQCRTATATMEIDSFLIDGHSIIYLYENIHIDFQLNFERRPKK
jgi:hypothetical protein